MRRFIETLEEADENWTILDFFDKFSAEPAFCFTPNIFLTTDMTSWKIRDFFPKAIKVFESPDCNLRQHRDEYLIQPFAFCLEFQSFQTQIINHDMLTKAQKWSARKFQLDVLPNSSTSEKLSLNDLITIFLNLARSMIPNHQIEFENFQYSQFSYVSQPYFQEFYEMLRQSNAVNYSDLFDFIPYLNNILSLVPSDFIASFKLRVSLLFPKFLH